MIVIDASLALDIAVVTADGARVRETLSAAGQALAAPEVIELEILQALRRLVRQKTITSSRARTALGLFAALEIERYSHVPLRPRIWALRENLTAYDAAYFALAELIDAPLWTRDGKFKSVPGHQARVAVL
ncbi:MAG: PIN domain-containing protein [Alphaproteobacteria bacterium]|nr:PIN domain-containing protein [Alphaproteobacteria bacterium]